jgi:probable rRNA maturation factor
MDLFAAAEKDTEKEFCLDEVTRNIISHITAEAACPYALHVDILLTNDEGMARVNHERRGINSVTDVLSFPAIVFEIAADFGGINAGSAAFDLDNEQLILGDIIICVPKIHSQAALYQHSIKREYAFLLTHALLHLLGYHHDDEDNAAVMEAKEEQILAKVGISRTDKVKL